MSGLGTTERDYATLCRGATVGEGLAVQGEEVGDADPAVQTWLRRNWTSMPRSAASGAMVSMHRTESTDSSRVGPKTGSMRRSASICRCPIGVESTSTGPLPLWPRSCRVRAASPSTPRPWGRWKCHGAA